MRYLALDIETTGLSPEHHHILQFGAVLDDLKVQAPIEELPTFQAYVLPPSDFGYCGEPYALQMNAGILRTIATRPRTPAKDGPLFLRPYQFMAEFVKWAVAQGLSSNKKPDKPGIYAMEADGPHHISFVPAGKNVAGFDLPFLRKCIPGWDQMRVRHRVLDPAMLYTDPFTDQVPPDLAECLKRAGLDTTVTHEALDDAIQVVRLLRAKYPLNRVCMCDGGGSLAHVYGPRCTAGEPV